MAEKTNKLLNSILLSAVIIGGGSLSVQAESLSFSDFSADMQAALKDKPTAYGTGSLQKFYEFQYDADGNIVMYEVVSPTSGAYTITYNYENSSINPIINTAEINDIQGNFINNLGTWTSPGWGISGGAIANYKTDNGVARIENIEGDFIGNHTIPNTGSIDASGGAIFNKASARGTAEISKITGNFVGNYAAQGSGAPGGALFSTAAGSDAVSKIGIVTGDFINNYVSSSGLSRGGAIANFASGGGESTIGTLNSNFIGNYAISESGEARGGTISNTTGGEDSHALIDNINGDFVNNYVNAFYRASGGAIYNVQLDTTLTTNNAINNIEGDFVGNYVISANENAQGGAISNVSNGGISKITRIKGNFIDNYAIADSGEARGGAIHNEASSSAGQVEIDTIEGEKFSGNHIKSADLKTAQGGAIYNGGSGSAIINTIKGDFIGNYIEAGGMASGGAIYSASGRPEINSIIGNFIGNYVQAGSAAYGGALCLRGSVGALDGITFRENYAQSGSSMSKGGAIFNDGAMGELTNVKFIDNYAKSTSNAAYGGAIYTIKSMKFTADNGETLFRGNYTDSKGVKEQNALYAESSAVITLNSVNKGQITFDDTINGQNGYKLTMTGDSGSIIALNNRVNNAAASLDTTTLKLGVTDSVNNVSDVFKNSTLNVKSGIVDTTDGAYTNYNIKKLTSSDTAKYSIDLSLTPEEQLADTFTFGAGSSGKIYLSSINVNNTCSDNEKYILQIIKAQDNSIQLDYDDSKVLQWATAKMTSDTILAKDFGLYTTNTTNDSLVIRGLLDSLAEWAELDTKEDKVFTFVDSSNRTLSRDITELNGENITIEGAGNTINIDNHKFLDLISGGQKVSVSDVTIENSNDITNDGILTLDSVILKDADIKNNKELNISGSSEITGVLTNNSDVNISDTVMNFDNKINGKGNLNISDSTISFNNSVSNQTINADKSDITLNSPENFTNNSLYLNSGSFNIPDLGLSNLALETLSLNGGNINIGSVDVDLANEKMGQVTADNYKDISGTINVNNLNLISTNDKPSTDVRFTDKALAASVRYNGENQVAYSPIYKYDVTYQTKGNGGYFNFVRSGIGTSTGTYNSSVFAAPVATQIGGFLTQSETLQQSFYHMNRYTKYTSNQRLTAETNNHYALTEGGRYLNNRLPETSKGIWYNPYTTFETVNLKGGIGVSNVTYGTLVGGDSDLYDLGHGYKGVISTFIGYNGSHQSYNGNSIYQNGGTLGVTGTLYKNNFFTGITASAGASTGSASTMYGTDNFTMLTAGVASKSGYNWEIHEGKFIVQPTLYLGYTFVNTFDYTNAAGVRINSDPLHALQIIPGVTFISNLKNGWQPYASVSMVFNTMDKTHFSANDVRLPQLSVKPYIQYGVGLQKTWKDKFTGFGQAMIRNGGRNGIALAFGFRYTLGKTSLNTEKTETAPRKIVKQLNIPSRAKQETTMTGNSAVMKLVAR